LIAADRQGDWLAGAVSQSGLVGQSKGAEKVSELNTLQAIDANPGSREPENH
jgi:hypothetical protein